MIGGALKLYGEWAPGETALFSQVIHKGDWIADVGANVGFHTLFFSLQTGDTGRVFGFEPEELNHRLLQLNMGVNKIKNAFIYNALVGRESRVLLSWNVRSDPFNRGDSRFTVQDDLSPGENSKPLMQIALDDMRLERCDLLKIDVQGYEQEVFRGAERLLESRRPLVFFEQDGTENFKEIMELLRNKHYRCYWYVCRAFPRFNIHGAREDIYNGEAEKNIFAVPGERTKEYSFLRELTPVEGEKYAPPALSELSEKYALKRNMNPDGSRVAGILNEIFASN